MAEQFDPYYTWFGIPPEEQPADHYRLLGVRPLESNDEVIVNATDQRMAYLRTFQVGKRAKESQRLLNEVAAAQSVLLDPKKKKEYDEQLRRKAAAKNAAAPTATAALPTAKPLRDSLPPMPQQPQPLQPVVLQPVVLPQTAIKPMPAAQPLAAASSAAASAFPTLSKPVKRGGLSMTTALLVGGGSAFAGLCVLLAALAWAAARLGR